MAIKIDLAHFYPSSPNEVFGDGFFEGTMTVHRFIIEMTLWKKQWDYIESLENQKRLKQWH